MIHRKPPGAVPGSRPRCLIAFALSLCVASILGLPEVEKAAGTAPLAPGDLDPTFSMDGRKSLHFGEDRDYQYAEAVAIQDDGKIIAAGSRGFGSEFALARLDPSGRLDPSFAGDGMRTITFERQRYGNIYDPAPSGVNAIALQPDGKIVAVGTSAERETETDFNVVRLRPNGRLDPTFSEDGRQTFDMKGEGYDSLDAVALQSDGKIVLAGDREGEAFAIARLTANGELDPTFSEDGKRLLTFSKDDINDFVAGVAVEPDGKIVVSGQSWPRHKATNTYAVTRLNSDGSIDQGFAEAGRALIAFGFDPEHPGRRNDEGGALALQPDGKIVIAGGSWPYGYGRESYFGVARLTEDGALDSEFDGDGRQIVGFDTGGDLGADASSLALQSDGRIVVAGEVDVADFGFVDMAIARLDQGGQLDDSFSGDGRTVTAILDRRDEWDDARSVAMQQDGAIVAAGFAQKRSGPRQDFALARFVGG